MNKLKDFLSDKSYGFYVTIVAILLTLVTAIVYGVGYSKDLDMSWLAFALLLIGALVNCALIALKQNFWGTIAMAAADLGALCIFIYKVYFYVSVVAYGINGTAFSPAFTSSATMLVLSLLVAIVASFTKQRKELN